MVILKDCHSAKKFLRMCQLCHNECAKIPSQNDNDSRARAKFVTETLFGKEFEHANCMISFSAIDHRMSHWLIESLTSTFSSYRYYTNSSRNLRCGYSVFLLLCIKTSFICSFPWSVPTLQSDSSLQFSLPRSGFLSQQNTSKHTN